MKDLAILLIEDDAIEAVKFKRILTTFPGKHSVSEAKNGEQALKLLEPGTFFPDLILLDLNMPKMNGLEFLKILKEDEKLRYIPVVILTTSNNQEDVKESYKTGIAGYIMKPLKYEDYKTQIKTIIDYWSSNELAV